MPDWIYGITEGVADTVLQISKEVGCKLAFDMHGIGIIEIVELGKNYGSRLSRIKNSYNWLNCMAHANVITVANPNLLPLAKRLFPKAEVYPIFGMVDIDLFTKNGEKLLVGRFPEKKQVLFIGSLYKWQGANIYLKAAQRIQSITDSFEFTLIGSTGKENEKKLSKQIDDLSPNINYFTSVIFENVPKILRGVDIVVIPRPVMLSTYFAFPQKLGEFMASGCCVIATNLPNHHWALGNPKCGFLCAPTSRGITNAILKAANSELQSSYRHIARKVAIEKFSHLKQAEKIYSLLHDYREVFNLENIHQDQSQFF